MTDQGAGATTTSGRELAAGAPRRGFLRRTMVGGVEILGRRARRELEHNTEPGEAVRLCLRGDLGHALVCLDDRILIIKSGFHAGTTFGANVTTIFYPDITGIQLQMHLVSGWIEISSPSFQGRERKHTRQPRSSDRDVYKLPNCVPINRRYADDYRAPLAELRRLVAAAKAGPPQEGVVVKLERLAALHREGLLDGVEFAAAKARVIGGGAA
jgi:hypothetical protein